MKSGRRLLEELSDEEIQLAAATLDDYTPVGQDNIKRELALRGLSISSKTEISATPLPSHSGDDKNLVSSLVHFFSDLILFVIGAFIMLAISGSNDLAVLGGILGVCIPEAVAYRKRINKSPQSTGNSNWKILDYLYLKHGHNGNNGDGGFDAGFHDGSDGGFDGGFDGGD